VPATLPLAPLASLLVLACAAPGDEPAGSDVARAADVERQALVTLHDAATSISDDEPREALVLLAPLIDERPDDAVARFLHGVALVALERFDEALPALEAAVALEPDDPAYLSVLARCRHELGDLDGAIVALEASLAHAPQHARTRTNLGHLYLEADRVVDAAEQLVGAVEQDAGDVDAHLGLGQVFVRVGDHGRAEAAFRTAAGLDGGQPMTVLQLGRALAGQGRLEQAAEVLAAGVAAHPDHALLRAAQATALGDAGRPVEARAAFEAALGLEPPPGALPSIHLRYGILLERLGEPAPAVDHLELALEGDPDLARAHEVLGLIHLDRDEPREAFEHLLASLDQQLVEPATLYHAARLAERLGRDEQALRCAGILLGAGPGGPETVFRVAQLRLRSELPGLRDVARARGLLEELVEGPGPASAATWDLLSEACAAQGDWEAALSAIEHALRVGDDAASVRSLREGRRRDYRARLATR